MKRNRKLTSANAKPSNFSHFSGNPQSNVLVGGRKMSKQRRTAQKILLQTGKRRQLPCLLPPPSPRGPKPAIWSRFSGKQQPNLLGGRKRSKQGQTEQKKLQQTRKTSQNVPALMPPPSPRGPKHAVPAIPAGFVRSAASIAGFWSLSK